MPDPLSDPQRPGQEFDADVVEAVARAIAKDRHNRGAEFIIASGGLMVGWDQLCAEDQADQTQEALPDALAAIAAARPTIEAEAFEKAARVAERLEADDDYALGDGPTIAAAIRSLIEPRP